MKFHKITLPNSRIIERPINSDEIKNMLCSKGPLNTFYSCKNTEEKSSEKEILNLIKSDESILFIRLGSSPKINDLFYLYKNLEQIKHDTILITSDGDRSVPSSYDNFIIQKILNEKKIVKWYSQNFDHSIKHDKLSYFPIGFDFHTKNMLVENSIDKKIKFMVDCRNNSPVNSRIKYRIFSDTKQNISHKERSILYKTIKNNEYIDFITKRKPFRDIIQDYSKYNFVISPRGNGLDTHRTWELFLLGVIVITKSSPLDKMFIENNLPVVILKDWDELNKNLPNKIEKWFKENIEKTKASNIFPRLSFDYWLNTTNNC